MSSRPVSSNAGQPSDVGLGGPIVIAIFALGVSLLAGLLFVPAGRLDWAGGWLCLAVLVSGFSAITAHVAARTPSLIRRRARAGAGTPLWDLVLVSLVQLAFVAVLVVGGLDA